MAEVDRIIRRMAQVKMEMNSHKGEITDISINTLRKLLLEEVDELVKSTSYMETIEEAADIYNYLTAIVRKRVDEYRQRK